MELAIVLFLISYSLAIYTFTWFLWRITAQLKSIQTVIFPVCEIYIKEMSGKYLNATHTQNNSGQLKRASSLIDNKWGEKVKIVPLKRKTQLDVEQSKLRKSLPNIAFMEPGDGKK